MNTYKVTVRIEPSSWTLSGIPISGEFSSDHVPIADVAFFFRDLAARIEDGRIPLEYIRPTTEPDPS